MAGWFKRRQLESSPGYLKLMLYAIPLPYLAVVQVLLLAIVTLSYEQIIHAYPGGGGAYIVARDNLGELPAQVAGAGNDHGAGVAALLPQPAQTPKDL